VKKSEFTRDVPTWGQQVKLDKAGNDIEAYELDVKYTGTVGRAACDKSGSKDVD
jgi:hypothetical protein